MKSIVENGYQDNIKYLTNPIRRATILLKRTNMNTLCDDLDVVIKDIAIARDSIDGLNELLIELEDSKTRLEKAIKDGN